MRKQQSISCDVETSLENLVAKRPGVVLAATNDLHQKEARYSSIVASLQERRQIVLNIEVTSACNLQCKFCEMHSSDIYTQGQDGRQKAIRSMSLITFQEIIDKCRGKSPLKILYFAGYGEPLLHPQLPEMIKVARKSGIAERIILITNGVLLDQKKMRLLVNSGVDSIRVSLDAFSPDIYQKIKGKDYGDVVRHNLEECLEVIRSEALPVSLIIQCMNWLSTNPKLQLETHKIIDYFSSRVDLVPGASILLRKEFGQIDIKGNGGHHHKYLRSLPCEQFFFQLIMHADGALSPCCLDFSAKTFVVGNIHDVSNLSEIIGSASLAQFQKKTLFQDGEGNEPCRTCSFSSPVDQLLLERRGEVLKAMGVSRSKETV